VVASKPQRVSGGGAAITSADLGGSSSYSNESLLPRFFFGIAAGSPSRCGASYIGLRSIKL